MSAEGIPHPGSPAISVVVPVHNEAENIPALADEIARALQGRDFEVIFVNDGSSDGTEAVLRKLAASHPWLRQIKHASSCGQSAAIRSGVRAARAPIVATLDGDGQNDPAFLPQLIDMLISAPANVALVNGRRLKRKGGFKRFQSLIANKVRASVLRDDTLDTGCGLKAFRREIYLALPYFDALHRFTPALVRREGYGVQYVDVVDRPRQHGQSHYGMWNRLWVGLLDLYGVYWLIRRRRRVPEVTEIKSDAR
ncbi:MAG TPA: glycosyltransferase family 2 protein [Xanthobacteraceae bacterium]|nr:glycosyltransferase family 2 protein [Xanthobacteraceae bacterium]